MAKVARPSAAEKQAATSLELITNLARLFWDDVADRIASVVKQLVEEFLEARRTELLGAGAWERTEARTGHRGGSYRRRLQTRWGEVELRIPRLADGTYDLEIIDRWGRRHADVDQIIGKLFLAGISTRRLERLADQLLGFGVSKAAVSEITKSLDAEVRAFRERAVPDTVRYLLLDGITAKVREVGVRGKVFLVAYGIHADGHREILGFVLADSESEANWRGFLQDLKARGLKGRALRLITIDGAKGLRAAVREVYPLKPVQRCLVHKIRNVLATCKVRNKARVAQSLRPIWAAKNRRQALAAVKAVADEWVVEEERAVATLKRDLHECLSYLEFPEEEHTKIRTTNALERAFREVRRRTRPMGSYANTASADRIMFGVTDEMNERWRGAPQLANSAG
jgi:putative transposase